MPGILCDVGEEFTYERHDRRERMGVAPFSRLVLIKYARSRPLRVNAGFDAPLQDRTTTSRSTGGAPRPESITSCADRTSLAHATLSAARSTPAHGLCVNSPPVRLEQAYTCLESPYKEVFAREHGAVTLGSEHG